MQVINLMLGTGRGGLEQSALDYALALQASGLPARTIAAQGSWLAQMLAQHALPFDTLRVRGPWDWIAARTLRDLVRHAQARVIIGHGNRALKLALRGVREVPILAVTHNTRDQYWRRCAGVIAITPVLAAHAQRLGTPVAGILLHQILAATTAERTSLNSPPVVGLIGRMHPVKGFDVLLDAAALLRHRGVDARLHLAGDGPHRRQIVRQAQRLGLGDRARFLGWASDKAAFFAAIDLLIVPSRIEPFGLVLLEGMAYGVPVIASHCDGPAALTANGAPLTLVPPGDAAALADAIAAMISDPARALAQGRAGQEYVRALHSPARLAAGLRAIVQPYLRADHT